MAFQIELLGKHIGICGDRRITKKLRPRCSLSPRVPPRDVVNATLRHGNRADLNVDVPRQDLTSASRGSWAIIVAVRNRS